MDLHIINPMIGMHMSESFMALLPEGYLNGSKGEYFIGATNSDNEAVGIMGFRNELDRIKITYLYVDEYYRGQLIGTRLLDTLIDFIESSGCYMDVEADFSGIYPSVYRFFERNENFDLYRYSTTYYYSPEDIMKSKQVKAILDKTTKRDKSFFDLKTGIRLDTIKRLSKEFGYIISDYDEWEKHCEKELCRCIVNDNNQVEAIVIVERKDKNMLSLSYLESNNPTKALEVVGALAQRYVKYYSDDYMMIEPVNETSSKILMKLLGNTLDRINNYKATWNYMI